MTATDITSSTAIRPAACATADSTTAARQLTPPHEHAWVTRSQHRTSQGVVRYVRCAACDVQRIDISPGPETPATPLTRPMSAVGSGLA